jgi:Fic family protein
MDAGQFKDSPSGTLIPTIANQMAFVPNPLPPIIDYSEIALPLAQAMQAIGELNAMGRSMTNPMLVIRPLQRKEALLSSAMEGTYTTANALVLAEADKDANVDAQTIEVRNYTRAFEAADKMRREIPISNRLIKETHRVLLSQVSSYRGINKHPGEYKNQQNFIGGYNRKIEDARFVPPPPAETELAMAELEKYINRQNDGGIPPIIDAALIHYQFETIHPFADGNGRVGRILIPIYLMEVGVLASPLLYLSPAVEGQKDSYVDLMLDVSKNGSWTPWIKFFLNLVTQSCNAAQKTFNDLEMLRRIFSAKISSAKGSARLVTIANELFISPVISIPETATRFSVSYPSAKGLIERLVDLEILTELSDSSNPKLYICWPVIDLSEGKSPSFPNP